MDKSSYNKNISGINTKNVLNKSLKNLKVTNSLKSSFDFKTDIKMGYQGKKQNQFKADAKIIFNSKEIWFVKISSSYRSDRIKGNEFDMEHIKAIYENSLCSYKVKCFFIMPYSSSIKDRNDLMELNNVIKNKSKVTYFDGAYIINEFLNKLLIKCVEKEKPSKKANILGNQAERWVVEAFSNKNNIAIWNNYIDNKMDSKIKSSNYLIFRSILKSKNIHQKIENILSIQCGSFNKSSKYYNNKLAHRKTGGKPKTDVYVQIKFTNQIIDFKVSVKFPNNINTATTVHQGKVDDVIIDLKNTQHLNPKLFKMLPNLNEALSDFQINGGTVKSMKDNNNKDFLANHLSEFNEWFIKYFIFGINNTKLNDFQTANIVTVFNPVNANVKTYNKNDILSLLLDLIKDKKANNNKPFNESPFQWTYQGKRGTNFQVKVKLHK